MTIEKVIAGTPDGPRTVETLARDLRALGIQPDDTLLVHSSLSSMGWVCGREVTVIQTLLAAVSAGTLVMPAHSADLTEPSLWREPAVPSDWWPAIRESMPPFDPATTPTRRIGRVPEAFRRWPGVRRSQHPSSSFAALGRHAEAVAAKHALDDSLGEASPLARLEELNAKVLLLGASFDSNTCFHLAEYRVPGRPHVAQGSPLLIDGRRTWTTWTDVDLDSSRFAEIGAAFEDVGRVTAGRVGSAWSRLFSLREAVSFAEGWMTRAT